ncbi:P-type ATPase (P-ATPase) Superfamily, partial [Trachipleistophora hominis]
KMFYIFILYFVILFASCTMLTTNLRKNEVEMYGIDNFSKQALKLTGTNYILYSYLIPLSLFVMIEVARIFQKTFVSYDPDIKGAYCRNSNVTEDIGMIDIILSDKTGTLTENKMNFRYYDTGGGIRGTDSLNINDSFFFVLNLLCNNELQLINNKYEGISQDEISIVEKLENVGCFLRNKTDVMLKIEIENAVYDVKVLAVLEFNSERQRMSTLVQISSRNERCVKNNEVYLFTKGSDQRLSAHLSQPLAIEVNSNYRSLLVVHRRIDDTDELNAFLNEYHENVLNPKLIESLFERLEVKLEFAGVAYIEDRIGFKVKDTVEDLKGAGIKIWMVTGDKKETALSCGRSVGITSNTAYKPDEIVDQLNENTSLPMDRAVWMDTLPDTLIIYRAIPDKKAMVAKELVKRGLTVLAIGDGNNDVSMINASTVGVGIRGKEGGQAALAGDFAIMSFHHLRKLLFHHGKNNLIRFSKLTINSFFKNIFLISFQFNYNFSNGFSGLSAFNYYFLNYFNILFTSFIPFTIAIFDRGKEQREFQDQTADRLLLESYKETRNYFSTKTIFCSMIFAIMKGCLLYWTSFGMLDWNYAYVTTYFSYVVFISTVIFQISLIEFFNIYTFISMAMTTLIFGIVMFGIDEVDYTIYGNPLFYFTLLAVMSINVGSDLIYKKI